MMVHRRNVDSLFDVPDHLVNTIKAKIGEDEDRLKHVEGLLEQWMRSQNHLPDDYDRKMARNFVRGAKFNLEMTKKKLEGYFLAKHGFPNFYRDRDPSADEMVRAFRNVNIVRLPKLTEDGERICYMSLATPDPSDFDMLNANKLFWMLYDLTLTSDNPIIGEILIFDCTHFSSGHMIKFLCMAFKHALKILQDAYAARICQVHVINSPSFIEKIVSAVNPFIHKKVRDRIVIHKGSDSLFKYLHPELLPLEVGGDLESVRSYMKRWQELLVENSDWFRQQQNVKIVGTPPKRIEKFSYDISFEGSFRQLNID